MIFRRVRSGWLRRAIEFMRWSRVAAYVCLAAAGVYSIAIPPVSVASATGSDKIVQLMWSLLMVIAASICAYGAIADRWVGEYVGLIPLGSVAAVYGLAAISRGQGGFAGGLFLVGFFWLLVSRWQEVALLRVEADRRAKDRNDEASDDTGDR